MRDPNKFSFLKFVASAANLFFANFLANMIFLKGTTPKRVEPKTPSRGM